MRPYTPVIKAKNNDIQAIALLSEAARSRVKPLIEVAIEASNGILAVDVDGATAAIVHRLPAIPFYFDPTGLVAPGEKLRSFESLSNAGTKFTPVFGLSRPNTYDSNVRNLVASRDLGCCVRLDEADLEDPDNTWDEIIRFCAFYGVEPGALDLIVDYQHIERRSIVSLREEVLEFLSLQPPSFEIGALTILGSSALSSVAAITVDGVGSVERKELQLWTAIQFELAGTRNLHFGDYGIVNPKFVLAGPNLNANAKIRYTRGGNTIYFRGHGLYNPSRFDQYHALASKVVNSEYYMGSATSFGDQFLLDCSRREVGTGNLATWVKVDTNHHVEVTSSQTVYILDEIATVSEEGEISMLLSTL